MHNMLNNFNFIRAKKWLSNALATPERRLHSFGWAAVIIGFVASFLSLFDICTGACSSAAQYTLFGHKFAWSGVIYFIVLGVTFSAWGRMWASMLFDVMVAGALGAEILFLFVQRYGIGHWCPICVIIALSVLSLAGQRTVVYCRSAGRDWEKIAARGVITVVVIVGGFVTAFAGIESPQRLKAAPLSAQAPGKATKPLSAENIWFGNSKARVEVYFVTDWYCTYCRSIEGVIEKMLPAVGQAARFTFLDLPAHVQSITILPYSASLLLNEKGKYLEGRRALYEVTANSKAPTHEAIVGTLSKTGIQFRAADKNELMAHNAQANWFLINSGVKVTPSVVVRNVQTGQTRLLSGADEIQLNKVLDAVKEIAP
jgi:protein-disulfide isomerase